MRTYTGVSTMVTAKPASADTPIELISSAMMTMTCTELVQIVWMNWHSMSRRAESVLIMLTIWPVDWHP